MCAPQWRHRPRKNNQLNTGTKSGAPSVWPHCGHTLRPFSGSMPRGSRHATTFIKLNSAAPSRKRMSPNRSSSSSMAHPRAVLQPVLRAENAVTAVGIIDGVHAVLLIQEPLHGVAVRVDLQKRHCAGQ